MKPAPADRCARRLVEAILEAADPARALGRAWPAGIPRPGTRYALLAIGKASAEMASAAAKFLGGSLTGGIVTAVPQRASHAKLPPSVRVLEADHPWPTPRNIEASLAVRELVRALGSGDELIALISGGGSAHLTLPAEGLKLDDLVHATRALQASGATIHELNTVRKHAEQLKGGRLAALCRGRVQVFVLSDVPGDALDVIASGPFAPDPTTYADALSVLERHGVREVSPRLVAHLRRGAAGACPETPKPGEDVFARVRSSLIAGNATALTAAEGVLVELGFRVIAKQERVEGDAAALGRELAGLALNARAAAPAAILWGGEPTVNLRGRPGGRGGPSQELALAAAVALDGAAGAAVITFSTDGVDGPPAKGHPPAAGAVVGPGTLSRAKSLGLDAAAMLAHHDSGAFFEQTGGAITTGPTGTNVNHVAVALVYP